jgi:hypothetical protein
MGNCFDSKKKHHPTEQKKKKKKKKKKKRLQKCYYMSVAQEDDKQIASPGPERLEREAPCSCLGCSALCTAPNLSPRTRARHPASAPNLVRPFLPFCLSAAFPPSFLLLFLPAPQPASSTPSKIRGQAAAATFP